MLLSLGMYQYLSYMLRGTSFLIMFVLIIYLVAGLLSVLPARNIYFHNPANMELLTLSQRFLEKVKKGEPSLVMEQKLSTLEKQQLLKGLADDATKKTFWINMYNAWYQLLAMREQLKRPEIFNKKVILVAGTRFSLDDMEHGILRKYRWKYSMGYFPSFFPGKLIKQLAVSTIDYRIHFALNCGAKSCPPILFYSYDNIQEQLNMATRSFLRSETEIDESKKEVRVSKIMDWFRGDFGGKKGIRRIIGDIFEKDFKGYTLEFKSYDWDIKLRNFQ